MLYQLTRQLKREISAHKGKATFLGVALLVAIYSWIPAIGSLWSLAAEPSPAAAQPPLVADASGLDPAKLATPEVPPAEDDWQELMTRIENEPLMKSAKLPRPDRDPFAPVQVAAEVEERQWGPPADTVAAEQNMTPDQLGMILSGILISPRLTVVKISGKTYSFPSDKTLPAQASIRKLTYPTDHGEVEFEIVSAAAGRLVLARRGKRFELFVRQSTINDQEGIRFLRDGE